ncbi:Frizzled-5 [Trichinella pseudospiralis]|nr:Frizzled-5 [Trichinella pseudospiralis]
MAGFVSLVRIHHIVKQQQGLSKIEKLEKLMVRIGIFSVLYTIPATILIGCYFYEQHYRVLWEMAITCQGPDCSLATGRAHHQPTKPEFSIAVLKYFMCLVVGITSGIWIWSPKTLDSWKRFCLRLCCCTPASRGDCRTIVGATTHGGKPLYVPTEAIIIKSHTDVSSGAGGASAGGYARHYPVNHL